MSPEDRRIFARLGYQALGEKYGYDVANKILHYKGGKVSSEGRKRDKRGRFLPRLFNREG